MLICSASPAWAASLTLSMHDGLVSIDAQDVTVRQILTEWARVGKTEIKDGERITGGPITLKFDNVPEKQALDIILRSIPGYMALPRATPVADASLYERILIMATTTAVAAARPPSQGGMPGGPNVTQLRPTMPPPLFPGMLLEPPDSGDQITDDPAIAAAAAAGLIPVPGLNPGSASNSWADAARWCKSTGANGAGSRSTDKPVERAGRHRATESRAADSCPSSAASASACVRRRPTDRALVAIQSTDAPSDETRSQPCQKLIGTGRRTSAA